MTFGQIAVDLDRNANGAGLKINTNKAQIFSLIDYRNFSICINRQNINMLAELPLMMVASSLMSPGSSKAVDSPSLFCLKFGSADTSRS